jgi:uncharacterized protein
VTGARTMAGDAQEQTGNGSLRQCAVTRAELPPDDLIRFVAAPDGSIVPDLARRLPGRGVWVTATRAMVDAAVRRKVFARSLKQQVATPEDLPDLVERLLVKRVAEALSLANKAGLLVAGFAKVEGLLDQGQAWVLLHASDAAADGVEKLNRKFKALIGPERFQKSTVAELTSAQLSLAIGRPNVVHAAASEGGASQRMLQEAVRLRRYRTGESAGSGPSCH